MNVTIESSPVAAKANEPDSTCEFCDKRGLPVLVTRFAVATSDSGSPTNPALPADAKGPTKADPADLGTGAHYTTRLLRSGYLYTYDEARRRWGAYFITAQGFLMKFPIDQPIPESFAKGREPCSRSGHRELAGLVTIPDAKNAKNVWFGFSDVQWTDATRKRNEDADYRKRHMQVLDVAQWLGGGFKGPFAPTMPLRPINQVESLVTEYVTASDPGKFAFSPFNWNSRQGEASLLIVKADTCLKDKGAILILDDPIGITQELASLMQVRTDAFINVQPRQWRLASGAAIEQIQAAIRNQAELDEMTAAENLANQTAGDVGLGILFDSVKKSIEDLRTVTPAELKRAADDAWQKYSNKYDESGRRAWQDSFNNQLKAFDNRDIAPLAQAHAAWMQNPKMVDCFDCNFDPADASRGLVYTHVLTRCIAGTQDKGACAALYDRWLVSNDASDRKNLLMRALVFNLDLVADAVTQSAKVSVDPRILQWDALFGIRDKALERLNDEAGDVGARLIAEVGGPLARVMGRWADGTPGMRAAVMATGLISGHPIVLCDLVGSRKTFRASLIRQLLQASGGAASERQMERAVAAELRRLEIHGMKLDGTDKKRWIVLADKGFLKQGPSGLKGQAYADWLASGIRTPQQVDALNLERWRTVINGNVRVGIIVGIIQFVSLGKLMEDAQSAMSNDAADAKYRAYAGMTALGATIADVIGNALAGRALLCLRFGEGTVLRAGIFLKFAGKAAGLGAGLVLAGLDAMKAYEASLESNNGLTFAYGVSALVGGSLSIALLGSAFLGAAVIPVIGVLILLLIGVTVLIEYLKDNKIQDWIERSPWGKLIAERYKTFEESQQQLKLAIAG